MAFETGKPRPPNSGRRAGTPNKKNQEIHDLANELGCSPAKILMLIVNGDRRKLGHECVYEVMKRNHKRAVSRYEEDLAEYKSLNEVDKLKATKPRPPRDLVDYTEKEIDEMNMLTTEERGDRAQELMPYLYGKRKPIDANGDDSSPLGALLDLIDANRSD